MSAGDSGPSETHDDPGRAVTQRAMATRGGRVNQAGGHMIIFNAGNALWFAGPAAVVRFEARRRRSSTACGFQRAGWYSGWDLTGVGASQQATDLDRQHDVHTDRTPAGVQGLNASG